MKIKATQNIQTCIPVSSERYVLLKADPPMGTADILNTSLFGRTPVALAEPKSSGKETDVHDEKTNTRGKYMQHFLNEYRGVDIQPPHPNWVLPETRFFV